jgi:hypothetical protein
MELNRHKTAQIRELGEVNIQAIRDRVKLMGL